MADDAPGLLTDLRIQLREATLRSVYTVASASRRVSTAQGQRRRIDLPLVSGRANLEQAIAIRLLTPRGELTALGHPAYGSRLHELIGRPNTATRRDLVRLYVLDALRSEPRIERVVDLRVEPRTDARVRDVVDVYLRVQAAGASEPVALGPFTVTL